MEDALLPPTRFLKRSPKYSDFVLGSPVSGRPKMSSSNIQRQGNPLNLNSKLNRSSLRIVSPSLFSRHAALHCRAFVGWAFEVGDHSILAFATTSIYYLLPSCNMTMIGCQDTKTVSGVCLWLSQIGVGGRDWSWRSNPHPLASTSLGDASDILALAKRLELRVVWSFVLVWWWGGCVGGNLHHARTFWPLFGRCRDQKRHKSPHSPWLERRGPQHRVFFPVDVCPLSPLFFFCTHNTLRLANNVLASMAVNPNATADVWLFRVR